LCSLHFEFLISASPHPKLTTLGISLGGQPVKHRHYLHEVSCLLLYSLCSYSSWTCLKLVGGITIVQQVFFFDTCTPSTLFLLVDHRIKCWMAFLSASSVIPFEGSFHGVREAWMYYKWCCLQLHGRWACPVSSAPSIALSHHFFGWSLRWRATVERRSYEVVRMRNGRGSFGEHVVRDESFRRLVDIPIPYKVLLNRTSCVVLSCISLLYNMWFNIIS
jgi:hypothetical protein